jgi:tetratricopeptide (TPR) repeat protein
MKPHAFIAMPFGVKPGPDGLPIDFDAVLRELLAPALLAGGCEPFRADEEMAAGDIRTDMFQELLVADLVLVDLTIDNPNVWYELGVRHALRARGVVLVQGPRTNNPFDTYTDRKLRYHLKDGRPDPAFIDADRAALATMVRESLATSTRRKVSPVYKLLPHLQQPQWRQLLLAEANEFSDAHRAWRDRMEIARRKGRPGDILVLAGETPTRALRLEAVREAGNALMRLNHHDFALEQFEAALAIDPQDEFCRRQRVTCLGRLGQYEDAQTAVESLIADLPDDPEAWSLAGRLAKERWMRRWRGRWDADGPAPTPAQLREAAMDEDALLEEAIEPYRAAFARDPRHFYSGINTLVLMMLRRHLGGEVDEADLALVRGGVAWAVESALAHNDNDFWALATRALLALLDAPLPTIRKRFKTALAASNQDGFSLDSKRQQVLLLHELDFRPEETTAALSLLDCEIAEARQPQTPRRVLLFSGHLMDTPERDVPRFPPALEAAAQTAIEAELQALGAGADDVALCQAASGGDLLFLEACQRRGVRLQVLLPFDEAAFLDRSVRPSLHGEHWCERYYALMAAAGRPPRVMEEELGPCPADANPFERCNQWLLNTALAWGVAKVHFICLWDGGGGDGPGGTAHMYNDVKRRTGRVSWIDTRSLAGPMPPTAAPVPPAA